MTQPTDKTGTWPTLQSTIVDNDTLAGEPPPPLPGPPPPPPPPPPDDRFGLGLLLGLVAVLALAGGVIAAWLLTHRDRKQNVTTVVSTVASATPSTTAAAAARVLVPSVVGLQEQQALVRIASAGLAPKTVLRQTRRPTGTVLGQRPAVATRVRRGSVVRIVVDGGSPAAKPSATTTAPASTTTEQTTTAPTATSTAPATTTASAPPEPRNATVPDVTGQPEAQAAQALWRAGVVPEFVFVPGTDTLGTVVAQAKPSGTTIPYHGHVQVNLSQGPHASESETVPSVVGQTLQQAVSTLNGAGLRLIFVKSAVSSRAQVGRIVDETPGANARAPKNAQILVFLGVLHPS